MNKHLHVVCPGCDTVNRVPADRPADAARCGACKVPLFQGHPVELDERRFERHLAESHIPLLVDFWAPWCGPCRMMAPQFERAARALEPHVRLAKIDTDAARALSTRLLIRSIPTLILFANGREIARASGAMAEPALLRWTRDRLAEAGSAAAAGE